MAQEVIVIDKSVNCYLIKNDAGFFLIDTGFSNKRANVENELEKAGCKPGSLKLIILTHGDTDHAGNGAYLRDKYGAKIAMHRGDSGIVERNDMSVNRKPKPDKISLVFRIAIFLTKISSLLDKQVKFERFSPDILVEDGTDLSQYGLKASIVSIPGHSKGSIAVRTAEGDLFCGDLLMNVFKPGYHFMIDDMQAANASVKKLKRLRVKTVYPGHGKPFSMDSLR
jgi:glyoxylase-like metal-dependent hydrolase (beta-lactamase superfamily II)